MLLPKKASATFSLQAWPRKRARCHPNTRQPCSRLHQETQRRSYRHVHSNRAPLLIPVCETKVRKKKEASHMDSLPQLSQLAKTAPYQKPGTRKRAPGAI